VTRRFAVKRLPDGRAFLNLGSSAHVAPGWNNVDWSWLLRLAHWPRFASLLHTTGILSDFRNERLRRLDSDAICWDLRRGVPFPDGVFDVVYHSHVLEHIEREAVPGFLSECLRVLKPGGTLRVVVPDLERLARRYVSTLERPSGRVVDAEYDSAVNDILDQLVRQTPKARSSQPFAVRLLEAVFVGDTSRSGERHRWMYDRFSLHRLLLGVGFYRVTVLDERTSEIEGWSAFGLDVGADGTAYKPDSLYLEARRTLR